MKKPIVFMPTRADIEALGLGDLALNAFGQYARVVEISTRGVDTAGALFVCYYTEQSPTSRMSMSMKEGEIVRTVALSFAHRSAEIEDMEQRMRAERAGR